MNTDLIRLLENANAKQVQALLDMADAQRKIGEAIENLYPTRPAEPAKDPSPVATALEKLDAKIASKPVIAAKGSGFVFGPESVGKQKGVKPELVRVATLALFYSLIDFSFFDGVRTTAEQADMVRRGVSKTMKSMHLPQKDGFGWAMDLVPVIGGKKVWDWDGCYQIACAVDKAATELGFADNIIWGGAWDRRLSDFGGDPAAYKREVELYRSRHPGPDFIDGPHYQWID